MRFKRTAIRNDIPLPANQGPPLSKRRQRPGSGGCVIVTIAGVVILFAAIVLGGELASVISQALLKAREGTRIASCQRGLELMGEVFKLYENESVNRMFPSLSATRGEFCPAIVSVYPEYLSDGRILACPSDPIYIASSDPSVINDESYFYLGYAITNEAEAREFIDAYRQQKPSGEGFADDLIVSQGSGTGGSDRIVRLREGIERNLPVRQDQIPIMFDRALNHHTLDWYFLAASGINVLYMDGHVAFCYEGEFPAQRWFLDALAELGD